MARAQDAPIRREGGIDPYVATSVQRGKEQAGNRLVAAMQEAGATSRAAAQEGGASARAAMTIQAQRQMEAARLDADDRRAAEAERGRRDDYKFQQLILDTSQRFQASQAKLQREHDDAVRRGEYDRADKLMEQIKADRDAERLIDTVNAAGNVKAIKAIFDASNQKQKKEEEFVTQVMLDEEKASEEESMELQVKTKTIEMFGLDKTMDYPVVAELEEERKERGWAHLKRAYMEPFGMVKTVAATPGALKTEWAARKERKKGGPQPMTVLQEQIAAHVKSDSPISIEQLHSSRIGEIERGIAEGSIQSQDIRNLRAVLGGASEALATKRNESESDTAKDFFRDQQHKVNSMLNVLDTLRYSSMTIKGRDNETVGKRMNRATGGRKLAQSINLYKQTLGTVDTGETISRITDSLLSPGDVITEPLRKKFSKETLDTVDQHMTMWNEIMGGI